MSKQWTKTGSSRNRLIQFMAVTKWQRTPLYLRWLGYGAQRRYWIAINSSDFDQWQYANLLLQPKAVNHHKGLGPKGYYNGCERMARDDQA